jgi:hypothetical protein
MITIPKFLWPERFKHLDFTVFFPEYFIILTTFSAQNVAETSVKFMK